MREKIVGILGGMGPEATIDMFQKIVDATPAVENEEHLRIIIDNNPKLPSRQDAILRGGPSPVPEMIKSGKLLADAGADFIILGANTAHWFQPEMQRGVPIPILHIIEETVQYVKTALPEVRTVGILATTGAMKTGMFPKEFEKAGITALTPDEAQQTAVMDAIMDFKRHGSLDGPRKALLDAAGSLKSRGALAIVMGCTEIPIFLKGADAGVPLIDPNIILADVVVHYARGGETPVSARLDR